MCFESIVVGWCAASLLAAGGLVVWFFVEVKMLTVATSVWRRRRRQHDLPVARVVDKRQRSRR